MDGQPQSSSSIDAVIASGEPLPLLSDEPYTGSVVDDNDEPMYSVFVEYPYKATQVKLYCSYDNFVNGHRMDDAADGTGQFINIQLPAGEYLVRFNVDGEYQVNDKKNVINQNGEEYNLLSVKQQTSSSIDTVDESDDIINDIDSSVYHKRSTSMASPSGHTRRTSVLNVSSMMSTLPSPQQNVPGDDDDIIQSSESLQPGNTDNCDSHSDNEIEHSPLTSPGGSKTRSTHRRAQRKAAQQDAQHHTSSTTQPTGGSASAAGDKSNYILVDPVKMREAILKREQEWKEAWVMNELRNHNQREQEKQKMRLQWNNERQRWLVKIKSYANETKLLRDNNTSIKSQLDTTKSELQSTNDRTLQQQRDREKRVVSLESEHRLLSDEIQRYKLQINTLTNDLHELQHGTTTASSKLESDNRDAMEKIVFLNTQLKQRQSTIDTLTQQLDQSRSDRESLQQAIDTLKAEYESKLTQLKIAESNQTTQATNDKVNELSELLNNKDGTIATLQSDLSSIKSQLTSLNDRYDTVQSQNTAQTNELQVLNDTIQQVKDELNTTRARALASEQSLQSTKQQYDVQVTELTDRLHSVTQQYNTANTQLNDVESDKQLLQQQLETQRGDFNSERVILQQQVESALNARQGMESQLELIDNKLQDARTAQSVLHTDQLAQAQQFTTILNDTKKQVITALQKQQVVIDDINSKYKKELQERRKYFNLVQELRGNIRVYCRTRPLLQFELDNGETDVVTYPNVTDADGSKCGIVIQTDKKAHEFEFDQVFDKSSTQQSIFDQLCYLVTSCLDGYNVCIFAYGQTGSGKTHTMNGNENDRGVNYRALERLFAIQQERSGDYEYEFYVSMKEIYNEQIRDLLDVSKDDSTLKIRQAAGGMYVENLTELPVHSITDVLNALDTGSKNRATNITNMNEHSSRSHSILSVRIVGHNRVGGVTYNGKLHLIDLAGSERISKSGAQGDRLKEAQAINKSLSALGDVIQALQQKQQHIPYRNSKLTYLLQDSLGGHAKTLMFVNLSAAQSNADETLCSLQFASRVRQVELGAAVKQTNKSTPNDKLNSSLDMQESKEMDPLSPKSMTSPIPRKPTMTHNASTASLSNTKRAPSNLSATKISASRTTSIAQPKISVSRTTSIASAKK